ncbi:MAG: 2,3-bisphosphoglycerate-independent phosphoglycerate mutase [Oceanicoccus sp.]|jgi:2,3-bisphosphoglycerate-independent phosphoglycerate mutase
MNKKILLCVLDGFGHGEDYEGNAILRANTPFIDELREKYPTSLLEASGEAVGIPAGTQGGSEVGHLTMGAGRIVLQPLHMIDKSIESGEFFKKPALLEAAKYAKENNVAFHIIGMISDQGIHADLDHALSLLDFAKQQGLNKVFVHGFTDGRDVPPKSLKGFIETLESHLEKTGGKLATLIGRYYAMDRDNNESRTQKAFNLLVKGEGEEFDDALSALDSAYAGGLESDYYFEPVLLEKEGLIKSEDAVVFFNFRTDRAAQLTEQLMTELNPHMVVFGAYTEKVPNVFPPQVVEQNLGSTLAKNGLSQLRLAETEKFAHMTFFFNSQDKDPYEGEDRIMVQSPKVASYAEKPEMSAVELTDTLIPELEKDYSFVALNFANLDLVGHSGSYEATIKAVEVIDQSLARIVPKALENDYVVLITGDHGNAERMKYDDGGDCPSHTRNPVPLFVIGAGAVTLSDGGLQDVAPTILNLMGLYVPKLMTGKSLIQ